MSSALGTLLPLVQFISISYSIATSPKPPQFQHVKLDSNGFDRQCHSSSNTWLIWLRGLYLDVKRGGVKENESDLDGGPNLPRWQCWFSTLVSRAVQATPLQQDITGNNMWVSGPVQSRSDSRGTGSHYRLSRGFMAYLGKCEGCLLLQNYVS